MILLDTNVVSELMRLQPDPAVAEWMHSSPRRVFWTASIVIAELLSGIELMPGGKKQSLLRNEVEGMIAEDFNGQILSFDLHAARRYAGILAMRRQIGRPIAEIDAMIASIAAAHGATLATRNIRDFQHCGISLVDPWQAP